jgi:hypothetical protein
MPDLQATNKESIKTYKKDEADSFEFLFITETLEHLKATNQFTANHSLLKAALEDDPNSVLDRAKTILSKEGIQNPKSYLKGSITNNPESLIKRPGKEATQAKPPKFKFGLQLGETTDRELRGHWIAIQAHTQLCDWEELDRGHQYFLAKLFSEKSPLTVSNARAISKCVGLGLSFEYARPSPRSLTELGELIAKEEERQKQSQETF